MTPDHYTNADPLYQRAKSHGVRTVPLIRSGDEPLRPVLLRVFGAGLFGALALVALCAVLWGGQ